MAGKPPLGQKDWTCPLKAGGRQKGRGGERRGSKHSAGPSQLLFCPHASLFHLDGGPSSSCRTWLKCLTSKRSSSAILSLLHYSLSGHPICSSRHSAQWVIRYLLCCLHQGMVPTTHAGTLHICFIHYRVHRQTQSLEPKRCVPYILVE